MARRRLLKLLRAPLPHFFQHTYRQSLVHNQVFFLVSLLVRPWRYRGVSLGSCRGRTLRRSHRLRSVSRKSSHVHPYPRGPQAYEEPLPAPTSCGISRPKWTVRFCSTILASFGHILPLPKFTVVAVGGNPRNLFDLMTNQKARKKYLSFHVKAPPQTRLKVTRGAWIPPPQKTKT